METLHRVLFEETLRSRDSRVRGPALGVGAAGTPTVLDSLARVRWCSIASACPESRSWRISGTAYRSAARRYLSQDPNRPGESTAPRTRGSRADARQRRR